MPEHSVSRVAQADLKGIARYTFERWGVKQAVKYSRALQDCFRMLAENPMMGRACVSIDAGIRRHEQGQHVIFYRLKPGGIRVVRILHQQNIPTEAHFDQ